MSRWIYQLTPEDLQEVQDKTMARCAAAETMKLRDRLGSDMDPTEAHRMGLQSELAFCRMLGLPHDDVYGPDGGTDAVLGRLSVQLKSVRSRSLGIYYQGHLSMETDVAVLLENPGDNQIEAVGWIDRAGWGIKHHPFAFRRKGESYPPPTSSRSWVMRVMLHHLRPMPDLLALVELEDYKRDIEAEIAAELAGL